MFDLDKKPRSEVRRGRCDVCGQPASYRVRVSENGRIRAAELCASHYEHMTDQRRTLSPFDMLFRHTLADDMIDQVGARHTTNQERLGLGSMGDRESIDFDQVLTEDGKDILQKAAALSQEYGSPSIDTEHVLYALIDNSVTRAIFERFKLSADDISQHIEHNYFDRRVDVDEGQGEAALSVSPRVKAALAHAVRASAQFGHTYVGPEHILVGLMDVGEGRAFDLLQAYGLTPESLRQKSAKVVGTEPNAERSAQSETPKLDEYSRELTDLALKGELDPEIGRASCRDRVVRLVEISGVPLC